MVPMRKSDTPYQQVGVDADRDIHLCTIYTEWRYFVTITYDVIKEKGGRWYVCHVATPNKPIPGTFKKDKKDAMHIAADYMGVSYKEYLKMRKVD